MWVKRLMGFVEKDPAQVRSKLNLSQEGMLLTSLENGKQVQCGTLTIPSLAQLREQAKQVSSLQNGKLQLSQVVANVQELHKDPQNAGGFFQVASQFNLLEMAHPQAIPEDGVGIYGCDHTQGPACAIACGGGTLYRNYYVQVGGEQDPILGQTQHHQIDCLAKLGQEMGNENQVLWNMQNGYALATAYGLEQISRVLQNCTDNERDRLRSLLCIGIQSDTQVTLGKCTHTVTQAYCSALPVAYGDHAVEKWEDFARLILEASYEATFCAAVVNAAQTGNRKVFLTLIGGGVFGNRIEWILDAIERSVRMFQGYGLDVAIVSYKHPSDTIEAFIQKCQ